MTYEQVIKLFGSQAAAARALGLKQPSIAEWKRSGITRQRQCEIELLTGGKLKADLPQSVRKQAA